MKKLQATVLIALSSIFFTTEVIAQNIPLACQGEESAGLDWKQGTWVVKKFNLLNCKISNCIVFLAGVNAIVPSFFMVLYFEYYQMLLSFLIVAFLFWKIR
jgi:hypothetical protein